MWHDFRFAARSFRRSPGFTTAAVVTLALGIGATTAVFAVVSAVILRPLPYREPDRLVMVWQEYVNRGWGIVPMSHANLVSIARQSRTLEALGGFRPQTVSFTDGDHAERLEAASITSGVFPMLGLSPATGRAITADDERAGADRVAILSDAFRRRHFGSDSSILGRTIALNGDGYRVIGVMPAGSTFPPRFRMTLGSASVTMPSVDVWMPMVLDPRPERVGFRDTLAIARLSPGATVEGARSEAVAMAAALLQEFPGPANTGLTLAIAPLSEQVVGDVQRPLLVLFGAVVLVVLIACANVAGMLVARATARQAENALRAALGASRGQLVRSAMAECLLLAGTSAAAGLLLALALTQAMTTAIAARIPQFEGVTLDVRLLGFAALLAVIVALVFGIVPVAYTSTFARRLSFTGAARGSAISPTRPVVRRTLIACEAALALFLLVGAGLLARSFYALVSIDAGFNPTGKLAVGLTLPPAQSATLQQRRDMSEALVSRLRAIPGILELGVSSSLPLTGDINTGGLTIDGRNEPPTAERPHAIQRRVDHQYLSVMGMQMVRGRAFTADDRPGAAPVAIVNEAAARQFWPGQDPIGQRVRPDGFGNNFWLTVVGVVKDVRYAALSATPGAEVYWPYALTPSATINVVVRSDTPAALLSATIRREVRQLDARLPALWMSTIEELVAESVAESRLMVVLIGLLAVFGLAVSAAGIYGATSFMVAQRQQDMAVRLALGASTRRVILAVVTEAIIPLTAGIAVGLIGAIGFGSAIADQLFQVSPADPLTLAAGPVVLLGAALLACCGPARRAAGIDPAASLRAQ